MLLSLPGDEMTTSRAQLRGRDPLKESAITALNRVIDPLLNLMMDLGVTVHELNQIIRERAVRQATTRVIEETGRESRARVAISTGLPRSEVARILNERDKLSRAPRGEHPVRRVLAAWHEDSGYLTLDGEPSVLPIFGGRGSFERLVKIYSGGTPVRAMLDELTRINAIERLPDQRISVKARLPIFTGLNRNAITIVGERGGDLMDTLIHNVRLSTKPLFEATALVSDADPALIAVIQREITQQGSNFINGAHLLLSRSRTKHSQALQHPAKGRRVGVTVYYFQEQNQPVNASVNSRIAHRTNLRRRTDCTDREKIRQLNTRKKNSQSLKKTI